MPWRTRALNERCPSLVPDSNNWLATQFQQLDLATVETFSRANVQTLKPYPELLAVLAQRMRATR